jgi:hypothetical protein
MADDRHLLDRYHGGRLCLSSRLGLAVVAGLFVAE